MQFIALYSYSITDQSIIVHEFMHSLAIGHPHDSNNPSNPYSGFGRITNPPPANAPPLTAKKTKVSGVNRFQTIMSYSLMPNQYKCQEPSGLGTADHLLLASRFGVNSKVVSYVVAFSSFYGGSGATTLPSGRVRLKIVYANQIYFSTVPPAVEKLGVGTITNEINEERTIYVMPYTKIESLSVDSVVHGQLTIGPQTKTTKIYLGYLQYKIHDDKGLTITVLPSDQDQKIIIYDYDPNHKLNIVVKGGSGVLTIVGVPENILGQSFFRSREVTVNPKIQHSDDPVLLQKQQEGRE